MQPTNTNGRDGLAAINLSGMDKFHLVISTCLQYPHDEVRHIVNVSRGVHPPKGQNASPQKIPPPQKITSFGGKEVILGGGFKKIAI